MPKSTFTDWRQKVELALKFAEANAGESIVSTRNALLALWLAADRAPSVVRDLYRQFDESELVQSAQSISAPDIAAGVSDRVSAFQGARALPTTLTSCAQAL